MDRGASWRGLRAVSIWFRADSIAWPLKRDPRSRRAPITSFQQVATLI